jgi:hypothetical protein
MGNTVGSTNSNLCNFPENKFEAYILGLWCADGFSRSSSIGVSNTDIDLIRLSKKFLEKYFLKERLRLTVYYPLDKNTVKQKRKLIPKDFWEIKTTFCTSKKTKHIAYHLYVNSRPFLRLFTECRQKIKTIVKEKNIYAYFAGRFDGDGSIGEDFKRDCRIVYSTEKEAIEDLNLLQKFNFHLSKVYRYRNAKTYVLYISRFEANNFLKNISKYSIKLYKLEFVPRRDLILNRP